MMTKEEVASIVKYCSENGLSHKSRLSELGIPQWKFYESKRRYAKEQADCISQGGEFIQLSKGGGFVSQPSFAAKTGRGFSKKNVAKMISIELRTLNGTMMRIQGELDKEYLQSIIQASSGRV